MSRVIPLFLAGRLAIAALPGFSLICSLAAAATPGPNEPKQAIPVRAWRDVYGGDRVPGSEAVLDAGHWNNVWRKLRRDTPPLDFTTCIAVVAYAGEKGTGGYSIRFMEPVAEGNDLLIRWQVLTPEPGSMQMQVLTQPWEAQAFERPKGVVRVQQLPDSTDLAGTAR